MRRLRLRKLGIRVCLRKSVAQIVVFSQLLYVGHGFGNIPPQMSDSLTSREPMRMSREANVFVYGDPSLGELVSVRLLGAVQRPGMYHVTPDTDLVSLLSLAGGTTENANINDLKIKRKLGTRQEIVEVDLEDIVEDIELASPEIIAGDTIMVPVAKKFFSENFMQTFAIITGLATIFGTLAVGLNNI